MQLSRARLTSYDVLREEITTYCECRGHAHSRNTKPKARHTQVEMTQWTSVHSAKARAKGKGHQGQQRTARTRTRNQLNVEIVESAVTTRRIVGARRTRPTKVVARERTKNRTQRTLTILTRQNRQTVNQKLQSVDSTRVMSVWLLWKCECLNGSRLELTRVQERQHGSRAPHMGSGFLVMWISLSTHTGEHVKSGKRLYVATIGSQSQSSRCPSASVQATVVCWRVHGVGWSCSHVW